MAASSLGLVRVSGMPAVWSHCETSKAALRLKMFTRTYEITASTCGSPVCPQSLAPIRQPATHASTTTAASATAISCKDSLLRPMMVMDPSEHISRIAVRVYDVALHWLIAMSKNASAR
eukprot:12716265-Heterocapsa_arctica.AAC.1